MGKKGGVLEIIGIIFIVFVVISLVVGIYFYNFYVFKTIRICIGDAKNAMIPCETNQKCINFFQDKMQKTNLSDAPIFLQEKIQSVMNEAIYCNKTCFVRNIRGINLETQKLEMLKSCNSGESEIKVDINGKKGLGILMWLKKQQA